ncbi:MAG TPA: tRNA (adenosine(37)-N6)-threonylcarbamoyltransferase complex dimerization subunit type 1 TsaB [Rhodothermales bacterium]|nr:tRNA (adenosine(37)-N6)-threonylcarbamoyltransferase complex dimerization subunit type 1 TsaB [Rhodothermales bacterium]
MPPTLLALETATDVCSVALMADGQILADLTLRRPRAHAESLVPMIQDALRYAGLTASALDAVAVSMGPGSYTGLRIGMSTAKGLAMAVDAKLMGVPSLEAMAAAAVQRVAPGDVIGALFNSRRHEVYAAAFRRGAESTLEPLAGAEALLLDDLPGWLENLAGDRLWLVGEGVPRAEPLLPDLHRNVQVLAPEIVAPSATWIAKQAVPRYEQGLFEDLAAFEPFYLKAFVAKKPKASIFEKLNF